MPPSDSSVSSKKAAIFLFSYLKQHAWSVGAGMALLIAALCARGESVIDRAQTIDRGYERVDEKLRALGADIVREDTP